MNRYLKAIRERIAEHCESEALGSLAGENDADESLFGPHRVQIRPAGDATTRTTVFGIIKPCSKVYTQIVTDGAKDSPKNSMVIGSVTSNSAICRNRLPGSEEADNDGESELSRGLNRATSIEGFWSIAKNRLVKFRGVNKNTFYLHLKECEFRYNYRNENLYLQILKLVRNKPLFEESP
ncbi:IS1595 family transposase [Chlorobaculum sp. 24CR]|uniref:IS1595 family transposase n=1 Tax=Chlorobaculum sp. 24CR TaxID=2508878 RepID=UPI00100BA642|nr:IS1595 family transposase [Chlorobaculum sp. 24CR]RXK87916.1 IS1595 family transposase [Chlorobaculum sp. 24CR]